MHLTGNRRHSIDAKLRLKLPATFRREFDAQVVLQPMKDALYGFTPEGHAAFVAEYFPDGYDPRNAQHKLLRRMLNGKAETVDIDSAGRICLGKLPEEDRPDFGDDRQVVLVGNEDHFEVWSRDGWKAQEERALRELEDLLKG